MAVSSGSPPERPREPAWKRFGLKLKYAKEYSELRSLQPTEPAITPDTYISNSTKRQTTNDSPSPTKKRKPNGQPWNESELSLTDRVAGFSESQPSLDEHDSVLSAERTDSLNHDLQFNNDNQSNRDRISEQDLAVDTVARPRRKSVTFTNDTKQENEGSSSVQERSTNQKIQLDEPTNPPSELKKFKKRKKGAQDSTAPAASSSKTRQTTRERDRITREHTPEYISYLQLFHSDRSLWKFNKNNQKGLLKNLFRTNRISPEFNEAILEYISGLRGTAARQRVVEDAVSVLREIAEKDGDLSADSSMESEEARRNAYGAALQRHLEKYERAKLHQDEYDDLQLEDMQRDAERGKRAEAVLQQLLEKELYPKQALIAPEPSDSSRTVSADTTSRTPSTTNTSPSSASRNGSKRKRRKARTQAASDEYSSDIDSSESEGDFNPKRGPATVHDALRVQPSPQLKSFTKPVSSPQTAGPKRKIFDDEFLDQIFPKKQNYYESAPKRKANQSLKPRSFAYTHGTKADESASEDE